jgi:dipeptidyl aminopeptidase/acylaminoacyl peptidase
VAKLKPDVDPDGRKGQVTTGDLFSDLDRFTALPRVAGLWLSPDGRRLVVGMSALDAKKTRYVPSLWEVDPDGQRPARRLTRGDQGENGVAFTPDGDLLFVREDAESESKALWRLPSRGGEAELLAAPPGGLRGVVVASETGTVVLGAAMLPSATGPEHDRELHANRKDGKVTAILHDEYPVRFWDHDLGPARTRLLAGILGQELRDVTGHVGRALHDDATWDITPDGRTIVTMWAVGEPGAAQRNTLVAVDVATGARRVLADDAGYEYEEPRVSPDGTHVAFVVVERFTAERVGDYWLAVVPTAGGEVRALTKDWDRWPRSVRWTPDGAALVVVADDHGHAPLWRVDAATGEVTRLTDTGSYSEPLVGPDGRIYALRSSVDQPPAPHCVTPEVRALVGPAPVIEAPGRLEEVTATASDGTPLRAWLARPHGHEPAPLLVWFHGGPLGSWNDWHWRWNPWLAVARGYAVLLPDPAISTGYGRDFIQRGWGQWGGTPYTDLMAITDAAVALDGIDETRTAGMGGSYGGYMANWVAGHTDRFQAIVTHASLWHLDQMGSTTDWAFDWVREMTPEAAAAQSPHRFVDQVSTPMLVIHGDRDYRVPIGQALTLWWDLTAKKADSGHRFLYFPDEGHWILKPNDVKVWYGTVFAFLAHHLHGERWQPPQILG